MHINSVQATIGARLVQLGCDNVLNGKDHAVLAAKSDNRSDQGANHQNDKTTLHLLQDTNPLASTHLAAYSTWKTRPAGE